MARTKTTVQITPLVICQGKIGNKNILNRKLKNIKKTTTHTHRAKSWKLKRMVE